MNSTLHHHHPYVNYNRLGVLTNQFKLLLLRIIYHWKEVLFKLKTSICFHQCLSKPNLTRCLLKEMSRRLLFNGKWTIFNNIMARTSYILMSWLWCPLCTRSIRLVEFLRDFCFVHWNWKQYSETDSLWSYYLTLYAKRKFPTV